MATEAIQEEDAVIVVETEECDDELTEYQKAHQRIYLGENVYSLLVVAPVTTWTFVLSLLVVVLKLVILVILSSDIKYENVDELPRPGLTFVKFFLIPIALAMQEDLIAVFDAIANGMWCDSLVVHSTAATRSKLYFGYVVRGIDGCMSLYVNYGVLLTTNDEIVNVFLNFAALQFLYTIDDIFYELMKLGFFGDQMEHMTMVCGDCSLKRRFGKNDYKIWKLKMSSLDTILFCFYMSVAWLGYFIYIGLLHRNQL